MQRILIKCVLFSAALLIAIVLIAVISVNTGNKDVPEIDTTAVPTYVLSEYDGRIALYKNGYSMPVEIYDVYIDSLPESERLAVETGICADTDEQAQKIIEAYTS